MRQTIDTFHRLLDFNFCTREVHCGYNCVRPCILLIPSRFVATSSITPRMLICTEPTLPALKRVRHYLRSSGRYGPSPFLVGHYGGLGELVQGFCRVSAVNGSTYILSHSLTPTPTRSLAPRRYSVSLDGLDETIDCDLLISSIEPPDLESVGVTAGVARCIAIINKPLVFAPSEADIPPEGSSQATDMAMDTALLIFPPAVLSGGSETSAAHVFVTGEGSMSAPKGNCTSHTCAMT